MPSPTFRAAAITSSGSGTLNVVQPAATQAGDAMVVVLTIKGTTTPLTVPAAWTARTSLAPYSDLNIGETIVGFGQFRVFTFTAATGGAVSHAVTFNAAADAEALIVAVDDAKAAGAFVDGLSSAGYTATAPSINTAVAGDLLMYIGRSATDSGGSWIPPAGMTDDLDGGGWHVATVARPTTGATGSKTGTNAAGVIGVLLGVAPANVAPNAPTLLGPSGVLDRATAQRFSWSFSDPDPGDSQSAYSLRYRLTSTTTWTTVAGVTPNQFHDFAALTFVAGPYEWQVATTDAQGLVGPFSASGFFTAADVPAGVTITAPINGSTIATSVFLVEWSTPDQTHYQVRRVADASGAANTAVVYSDTGQTASVTARAAIVAFPTNSRWEHVQVRRWVDGLPSPWVSVRVQVAYTPPATPIVSVVAGVPSGAISVEVTHPSPTGAQPAVSSMNIRRRRLVAAGFDAKEGGASGIPLARGDGVSPTAAFEDWEVRSAGDYEYAVEAVGANGTSVVTAFVGGAAPGFGGGGYLGGYQAGYE